MIIYTWNILRVECYPQKNSNQKVVFSVHWECTGTENNYFNRIYNTCKLPESEGTFIPYENLTQEQVLGWCWSNGVDKNSAEAAVAQQIENQKNPPVIQPTLPWL